MHIHPTSKVEGEAAAGQIQAKLKKPGRILIEEVDTLQVSPRLYVSSSVCEWRNKLTTHREDFYTDSGEAAGVRIAQGDAQSLNYCVSRLVNLIVLVGKFAAVHLRDDRFNARVSGSLFQEEDGEHSMVCTPTTSAAIAPPTPGNQKTLIAHGWMEVE